MPLTICMSCNKIYYSISYDSLKDSLSSSICVITLVKTDLVWICPHLIVISAYLLQEGQDGPITLT